MLDANRSIFMLLSNEIIKNCIIFIDRRLVYPYSKKWTINVTAHAIHGAEAGMLKSCHRVYKHIVKYTGHGC